jgi:hypothetical protein
MEEVDWSSNKPYKGLRSLNKYTSKHLN